VSSLNRGSLYPALGGGVKISLVSTDYRSLRQIECEEETKEMNRFVLKVALTIDYLSVDTLPVNAAPQCITYSHHTPSVIFLHPP